MSNPTDTNQASDDTQKAPTRTLSEQHAQHGTATSPIISDTNQASEDELDEILEGFENDRRWDSLGEPANEGVSFLTFDEAKQAIQAIIRTEKLKLLAEVRERVVGEDRTSDDPRDFHLDIRNKLRANQREQLTKLEAEL